MPDGRLRRTRASLPASYQFGDARIPKNLQAYLDVKLRENPECPPDYIRANVLRKWNDLERGEH